MKIQNIERIPVLYHIRKKGWGAEDETGSKKYSIWPSTIPSVIIKVHTSDGQVGVGEAVNMHWYLGNTQAQSYRVLGLYDDFLRGKDPVDLEILHKGLVSIIGRGAPGARAADDAISMALFDLLGKAWGEPVYNILGGAHTLRIPINPNIYMSSPDDMAEEAKRYLKNGFRAIKIKCGMDIEEKGWSLDTGIFDVRKLIQTLDVIPGNIMVDADPNQSWGPYKRTITIVKSYGLERYLNLGIEQPVQYMDIDGASRIAKGIGLPLILDESIFSIESFAEVIKRGAADRIVLKTVRVGGLFVGRKIINMAEAFNIGVSVDSLPYSKIGDTAIAHLAATIREPQPGGWGDDWLAEDTVKHGGVKIHDGFATIEGKAPGLGIELDDEAIDQIRVKPDY